MAMAVPVAAKAAALRCNLLVHTCGLLSCSWVLLHDHACDKQTVFLQNTEQHHVVQ